MNEESRKTRPFSPEGQITSSQKEAAYDAVEQIIRNPEDFEWLPEAEQASLRAAVFSSRAVFADELQTFDGFIPAVDTLAPLLRVAQQLNDEELLGYTTELLAQALPFVQTGLKEEEYAFPFEERILRLATCVVEGRRGKNSSDAIDFMTTHLQGALERDCYNNFAPAFRDVLLYGNQEQQQAAQETLLTHGSRPDVQVSAISILADMHVPQAHAELLDQRRQAMLEQVLSNQQATYGSLPSAAIREILRDFPTALYQRDDVYISAVTPYLEDSARSLSATLQTEYSPEAQQALSTIAEVLFQNPAYEHRERMSAALFDAYIASLRRNDASHVPYNNLALLLLHTTEAQRNVLVAEGARVIHTSNPGLGRQFVESLKSLLEGNDYWLAESSKQVLGAIFNLPLQELLTQWREHTDPENYQRIFEKNLQAMCELERLRPGICNFLLEYTHHFARYPRKTLIRMWDDREKPLAEQPESFSVVSPAVDHNSVFYPADENTSMLAKLDERFERLGVALRIAEYQNPPDSRLNEEYFRRIIAAEAHRYGTPLGGILGGHGTADRIRFGQQYVLTLHDLSRFVDVIKPYYKENPTFILRSCSTGAENGLAQHLSAVAGAHAVVYAPQEGSVLDDIVPIRTAAGAYDYDVTYTDEQDKSITTSKYQGGTRIYPLSST